jgi:hypothetical protein
VNCSSSPLTGPLPQAKILPSRWSGDTGTGQRDEGNCSVASSFFEKNVSLVFAQPSVALSCNYIQMSCPLAENDSAVKSKVAGSRGKHVRRCFPACAYSSTGFSEAHSRSESVCFVWTAFFLWNEKSPNKDALNQTAYRTLLL